MRIWLLTSELPREFAGGIARYVDTWARLLGAAGHEVVIIARTDHACDQPLAPGVRLLGVAPRSTQLHKPNLGGLPETHPAYPYNVLSPWPALSYQIAEEVLNLLRHEPSPDIIESQEYGALPYFLLQRKLTEHSPLSRAPILVHQHSPYFALAPVNQEPCYRFPEYWVGQMEKFCLMSADALLSPSEYLACHIRATLRLPLEIACIPYPFVTHDKSVSPKAQPGHLVYVGRLEVRKGVLPLVEACSRLWSAGSDFRLTLIGGDVEFYPQDTTVGSIIRQQYKKWIESGRLTLVGQLEHAEVFRFMQQAWAVVIPSLWENFPHTCMEAMGSGQIILASRSGGQAEMIQNEGSEGFLFDWGIPGDFAQKLHRVLTLGEEERKKMGQCARARIQSLCAPEVILPQRLHHYETVIAHHQPRRFFPLPSGGVASWRAKFEERAGGGSAENEEIGLLSVVLLDGDPGLSVGETCKSLRAATYVPLEILFVQDEGAEEKSRARLREIEKCGISHPRVLRAKDANSEAARKTGIEMAKGQFITFIDLGDCVAPEFFERAIAVLQRYPNVAFVYSWVRSLGPSPSLWPTWNAEFPALLGRSMLSRLVVARKSALVNLRRDARQGEFDGENLEEWIALVAAGEAGVSLPHPLVSCRARPETLSLRARRNRQFHQYDLLTKRYADAYREWSGELLNLHNANGPAYLWNHYAAIESNEVSWRDYEIGGRLVSRLRKLWPVRQVLRSPMLKKVLRKLLES